MEIREAVKKAREFANSHLIKFAHPNCEEYEEAINTVCDLASHNIEEPKCNCPKDEFRQMPYAEGTKCKKCGGLLSNDNPIDECPEGESEKDYYPDKRHYAIGTGKVAKKPFPEDLVRGVLEKIGNANGRSVMHYAPEIALKECEKKEMEIQALVEKGLSEIQKLMEG